MHRWSSRSLSHGEKIKLQKSAASQEGWQGARLAMTLALNTTMRGCEIKGLQWRDINFFEKTLTIRHSKTEAGERVIPLNHEAWQAMMELRERGKQLGSTEPDHFAFPACETGHVDPTKPAHGWRSAWRRITKLAGIPGFRFHDLRHHSITELAESETPETVIMSIAGHVSRKMLEHYSHVRLDAKRRALDSLNRTPAAQPKDEPVGYDTKHDTNGVFTETVIPEVIEEYGGRRRDRTGGLCIANAALSQLS